MLRARPIRSCSSHVRPHVATQKSFPKARARSPWVGMLIDESHRHPDAQRERPTI